MISDIQDRAERDSILHALNVYAMLPIGRQLIFNAHAEPPMVRWHYDSNSVRALHNIASGVIVFFSWGCILNATQVRDRTLNRERVIRLRNRNRTHAYFCPGGNCAMH